MTETVAKFISAREQLKADESARIGHQKELLRAIKQELDNLPLSQPVSGLDFVHLTDGQGRNAKVTVRRDGWVEVSAAGSQTLEIRTVEDAVMAVAELLL